MGTVYLVRRNQFVATVESPCVRNCCLDDNDICVGCYRSLVEITRWSLVDDDEKALILLAAAARCSKKQMIMKEKKK